MALNILKMLNVAKTDRSNSVYEQNECMNNNNNNNMAT